VPERKNFDPFFMLIVLALAGDTVNLQKCVKSHALQVYRSGGDKQKYLEIKIEHVLIASFDQGGGDDFPTEIVSFAPGKISMTYSQQNREGGAPIGSVAAGWDLTANKAV
jgi:type VI secretion system secreted protein Hcp